MEWSEDSQHWMLRKPCSVCSSPKLCFALVGINACVLFVLFVCFLKGLIIKPWLAGNSADQAGFELALISLFLNAGIISINHHTQLQLSAIHQL